MYLLNFDIKSKYYLEDDIICIMTVYILERNDITMNEQFYIDVKSVPKVFRDADKEMEKRYPQDKKQTTPKEIPVPYIASNPNVPGPIYVTEDWYLEKKEEQLIERAKDKRDAHIEMMQLLAAKDRLRIKLSKLDPGKKKDSKMIAAINVRIKDIDAELGMLEMQYGINLKELDHGTRLARFVSRIKRKAKKVVKKVKRYIRDNSDFLMNLATIVLPVIGGIIYKFLF